MANLHPTSTAPTSEMAVDVTVVGIVRNWDQMRPFRGTSKGQTIGKGLVPRLSNMQEGAVTMQLALEHGISAQIHNLIWKMVWL